jgi:hypothetical protein
MVRQGDGNARRLPNIASNRSIVVGKEPIRSNRVIESRLNIYNGTSLPLQRSGCHLGRHSQVFAVIHLQCR